MNRFILVSVWRVRAPREAVWSVMLTPQEWPRWWPGLESVQAIAAGDADGIGSIHRFIWRSPLRFRLRIDMRTTAVMPHQRLAADASGDAVGSGEWRIRDAGGETIVEYHWRVRVVRPVLRQLASLFPGLFARSHRALMTRGARGLGRELGCRVRAEC